MLFWDVCIRKIHIIKMIQISSIPSRDIIYMTSYKVQWMFVFYRSRSHDLSIRPRDYIICLSKKVSEIKLVKTSPFFINQIYVDNLPDKRPAACTGKIARTFFCCCIFTKIRPFWEKKNREKNGKVYNIFLKFFFDNWMTP